MEDPHTFRRPQSSSAIAVKTALTILPIAPATPSASGSNRALPSAPNRARNRLAAAAPLRVAISRG